MPTIDIEKIMLTLETFAQLVKRVKKLQKKKSWENL